MRAATLGSLFAVGAVATISGVSFADRAMNYVETPAVVTAAEVDCYVKASKSELIDKTTNELAYMDCDLAPLAAQMHGFKEADIKKRTKLKFKYVSVADGSKQVGTYEDKGRTYKVGQKIQVYSHKTEPQSVRVY